jgi:hypothetical protein
VKEKRTKVATFNHQSHWQAKWIYNRIQCVSYNDLAY